MKIANFSIVAASRRVASTASVLVTSLGTVANWQAGVSSRSVWNSSLRDAHLDVVGLAGEQQQRLVLRLPAEAGDGAVVAVVVGLTRMIVRPATGKFGRPRMPSCMLL